MDRETYLTQRTGLQDKAQNLIDSGDIEGANAVMAEIDALDAKYEASATAQANLKALSAAPVVSAGVEAGMVTPENSLIIGKGEDIPENNIPKEDPMYLTAFGKAMLNMELTADERKAVKAVNYRPFNAANTAEDNALLIPKQTQDRIWRGVAELHPILSDTVITHINADITLLKDNDTTTDAEWLDEATEMADGTIGVGAVILKGCELGKSIPISWSLKHMAIPDFLNYLADKITEKMGNALAKAEISGKGKPGADDDFKPQPRGVVTALEAETETPQVVTYDSSAGITYKNITSAFAKIKSGYTKTIYANNSTIWDQLANILDNNKRPLFIADTTAGGVGRILGAVVKEEAGADNGVVLVGDPQRGYGMNEKVPMTLHTEDHAKKRITDYVAWDIIDGDVIDTKAFAVIKPATAATTATTEPTTT